MLIPPSFSWLYAMRMCLICGQIEYSVDDGESWTDEYPDLSNGKNLLTPLVRQLGCVCCERTMFIVRSESK